MTAQQKARPDGQSGTGFTTPKQTYFTPAIGAHFPPHFWQSSDASTCNRLPRAGTVGDNGILQILDVIKHSHDFVNPFFNAKSRDPNKAARLNKVHVSRNGSESWHPSHTASCAQGNSSNPRTPMQTQSHAQQADTNAPVTNQFKPFDWHNADVAGPHGTDRDALVDLLSQVRDITYGAATVMELSLHCQFDTDEGRTPLLRPCDLGGLERLATRALMMLSDNAGRVSDRLNNQPTPEKAGQP